MIELILRNYLTRATSYPVYLVVPEDRVPKRYYVIEKTGGGISDRIRNATVAIQSYAETLADAARMNEELIDAMFECNDNSVAGVRLNSDYNFTDAESKKYRYLAVFDITHY